MKSDEDCAQNDAHGEIDADLARVVDRWSKLSPMVRRAILAMTDVE